MMPQPTSFAEGKIQQENRLICLIDKSGDLVFLFYLRNYQSVVALLLLFFYSSARCDQHNSYGGTLVVQSFICLLVYVIGTI